MLSRPSGGIADFTPFQMFSSFESHGGLINNTSQGP